MCLCATCLALLCLLLYIWAYRHRWQNSNFMTIREGTNIRQQTTNQKRNLMGWEEWWWLTKRKGCCSGDICDSGEANMAIFWDVKKGFRLFLGQLISIHPFSMYVCPLCVLDVLFYMYSYTHILYTFFFLSRKGMCNELSNEFQNVSNYMYTF